MNRINKIPALGLSALLLFTGCTKTGGQERNAGELLCSGPRMDLTFNGLKPGDKVKVAGEDITLTASGLGITTTNANLAELRSNPNQIAFKVRGASSTAAYTATLRIDEDDKPETNGVQVEGECIK